VLISGAVLASVQLATRPLDQAGPSASAHTGSPAYASPTGASVYRHEVDWTAQPRPVVAGVSGGLDWAEATTPDYRLLVAVPNGYVLARSFNFNLQYTSRDGVSWSWPPDPEIFVADPEWPGYGWFLDAGWASPRPIDGPAGYILPLAHSHGDVSVSSDGMHWRAVPTVGLVGDGLIDIVGAGPAGYLAREYQGAAWLTSPDAVNWTEAPETSLAGLDLQGCSFKAAAADEPAEFWCHYEGQSNWRVFPIGPHSPFLAAEVNGVYFRGKMESSDRIHWATVADRPFLSDQSPMAINGRVFALSSDSSTGDGAIWTSSDGSTWKRVVGADGLAIVGEGLEIQGGRLMVTVRSERTNFSSGTTVVFVGTPSPPPSPPLVPIPSPVVWPTSSTAPRWTPSPKEVPTGGISREEAVRIASRATSFNQEQIDTATAEVHFDSPDPSASSSPRWMWSVEFVKYAVGPLGAEWTTVAIDYFTGEVLGIGGAVS
jgi:hypothetical protein